MNNGLLLQYRDMLMYQVYFTPKGMAKVFTFMVKLSDQHIGVRSQGTGDGGMVVRFYQYPDQVRTINDDLHMLKADGHVLSVTTSLNGVAVPWENP